MLTSDHSLLQSAPVWRSRLDANMGTTPQSSVPTRAMPMLTSDDSLPEVRRIGRGSLRCTLYSLLSTLYSLLYSKNGAVFAIWLCGKVGDCQERRKTVQSADGALKTALHEVLARGQIAAWRALSVLTFLVHGLVWAEPASPRTSLPSILAVPLCRIARFLDVQPILSYACFNLLNYKFIDGDDHDDDDGTMAKRTTTTTMAVVREPALGSVFSPLCFNGGRDEMWFRAVHIAIEAQFGACLVDISPPVSLQWSCCCIEWEKAATHTSIINACGHP